MKGVTLKRLNPDCRMSDKNMPSITTHNRPNPTDRGDAKLFTLVFVKSHGNVLLGMKKRGFGAGKWNGFGGKVGADETVEQGAIRELQEECGLSVTRDELTDLGYVTYIGSEGARLVHVFAVSSQSDTCCESEEMLPKWFKFEEVPYDRMWPDSEYWLPYVLSDTRLRARFVYGSNEEIVFKWVDEITG